MAVREGFLEEEASEITWGGVGASQGDLWEGTVGSERPSTDRAPKTRRATGE